MEEYARGGGLDASEIETIKVTLRGGAALPPPDFGYLRQFAVPALSAARKLIASDGKVTEDEEEMLEEIKTLLGLG
ncbi:MAG: hypothetical protein GY811_10660 [Myxococcales bacterium]|nr:hypothetical protein [Myxococcales bacterium]